MKSLQVPSLFWFKKEKGSRLYWKILKWSIIHNKNTTWIKAQSVKIHLNFKKKLFLLFGSYIRNVLWLYCLYVCIIPFFLQTQPELDGISLFVLQMLRFILTSAFKASCFHPRGHQNTEEFKRKETHFLLSDSLCHVHARAPHTPPQLQISPLSCLTRLSSETGGGLSISLPAKRWTDGAKLDPSREMRVLCYANPWIYQMRVHSGTSGGRSVISLYRTGSLGIWMIRHVCEVWGSSSTEVIECGPAGGPLVQSFTETSEGLCVRGSNTGSPVRHRLPWGGRTQREACGTIWTTSILSRVLISLKEPTRIHLGI